MVLGRVPSQRPEYTTMMCCCWCLKKGCEDGIAHLRSQFLSSLRSLLSDWLRITAKLSRSHCIPKNHLNDQTKLGARPNSEYKTEEKLYCSRRSKIVVLDQKQSRGASRETQPSYLRKRLRMHTAINQTKENLPRFRVSRA